MIRCASVKEMVSKYDQMGVSSALSSRRDHDSFRTGVEMNFGRIEHLKFEFKFMYPAQ